MDIAKAVRLARHELELEGFIFTDEELAMQEQLAKGEITTEDIRKHVVQCFSKV